MTLLFFYLFENEEFIGQCTSVASLIPRGLPRGVSLFGKKWTPAKKYFKQIRYLKGKYVMKNRKKRIEPGVEAHMSKLNEHAKINRSYWDEQAKDWAASGKRGWAAKEPNWGIWKLPESDLFMLPSDMSGMQAIELGCGTAYVSAWMARRGANVVGIDNSIRQLETAQQLVKEYALPLTLLHGNAEEVPYPDQSFDFAISEYGAAVWCDPYRWIPEAHRLLRTGGELVFLSNSTLVNLCTPTDGSSPVTRLERDYFDMHRFDWTQVEVDPSGIEFNLPLSSWLALFRKVGFDVLDFLELRALSPNAEAKSYVSAEWAYRWPAEQVWKLRRKS